jgi:dihydroflavonol-4-reductase
LQRGFRVRCLVRRSRAGLGWIEGLPVEVVRASYYDTDSLREAVREAEYIFHIAGVTKAKSQREYYDGNVLATKNLLEAAGGIAQLKKFCYISSLSAAGPSPDGTPLTEETACSPITTYGVTKLQAETVCQLHSDRIPVVILRPPPVYGPRDRDTLEIFRWVKRGVIPVFGQKEKRLSLVYGPELARGIVDATISEKTVGQTYFIADGPVYRQSDVLDEAARILGKRTVSVRIPSFLLYPLAGASELISAFSSKPAVLNIEKARDLLQPSWVCNPKKLEEHIGFRNQVPIEEGLRRTLEWYKDYGWL